MVLHVEQSCRAVLRSSPAERSCGAALRSGPAERSCGVVLRSGPGERLGEGRRRKKGVQVQFKMKISSVYEKEGRKKEGGEREAKYAKQLNFAGV